MATPHNTAIKNLYAGLGYVCVQRAENGEILKKEQIYKIKYFTKEKICYNEIVVTFFILRLYFN